jgi:hypothetical protein
MERSSARQHRKGGAVLAALLVLGSLVLTFGVGVPAAQAHCAGANNPGFVFVGDWGKESARGGFSSTTCDGDHIYRGNVYDTLTDGSCVTAQYSDNNQVFNQATSCDAAGLAYTFFDQNGNSSASLRLCRNQGCGAWVPTFGY